jgi:hypothetical protein
VKLSFTLRSEEARRRQVLPIVTLALQYPRFFLRLFWDVIDKLNVSILAVLLLKHTVLYRSLDVAVSPTLFEFKI